MRNESLSRNERIAVSVVTASIGGAAVYGLLSHGKIVEDVMGVTTHEQINSCASELEFSSARLKYNEIPEECQPFRSQFVNLGDGKTTLRPNVEEFASENKKINKDKENDAPIALSAISILAGVVIAGAAYDLSGYTRKDSNPTTQFNLPRTN